MDITPFTVAVPDAELEDCSPALRNTRWPSEWSTDWSRGVPTAVRAAGSPTTGRARFDWRAQEARLNTFPQFTTEVDGQTIHFVHVRSAVPGATPLLLLHGYPSSFVESIRMIGPLVDPVAHGGRPEDAFHVVVPSLPGLRVLDAGDRARLGDHASPPRPSTGSCRRSATTGTASSGGDIGAGVAEQLCIQAGDRVIGSLVVTDPGAIATEYTPPTDHLTDAEQERHRGLKAARAEDFGYLGAPDDAARSRSRTG